MSNSGVVITITIWLWCCEFDSIRIRIDIRRTEKIWIQTKKYKSNLTPFQSGDKRLTPTLPFHQYVQKMCASRLTNHSNKNWKIQIPHKWINYGMTLDVFGSFITFYAILIRFQIGSNGDWKKSNSNFPPRYYFSVPSKCEYANTMEKSLKLNTKEYFRSFAWNSIAHKLFVLYRMSQFGDRFRNSENRKRFKHRLACVCMYL